MGTDRLEVIVPKKDLLPLVAHCQGVVERKSPMPALANILLTAEFGRLVVAATDLYLGFSGSTLAEVDGLGTIALPAKDLLERVKAMPEGPIQIKAGDGAVTTIKAVGTARKYMVHGLPGEEYPKLAVPREDVESFELPLDVLAALLSQTHFSISSDETRPNVNSACLECSGDRLRVISTDGHRMTKADATLTRPATCPTMLIPLKAVLQLRRLLEAAAGEKDAATVKITPSGPTAFFAIASWRFSVKLVDASFPPYEQVIPKRSTNAVRVPRKPLIEVVNAVAIASSERTGGVRFDLSGGVLAVSAETAAEGRGDDQLTVDYDGPTLRAGFTAKYLTDALGAVESDEAFLHITGELDPMLILPAEEAKGRTFTAVVMPMRI